jgi:hypothetical protein
MILEFVGSYSGLISVSERMQHTFASLSVFGKALYVVSSLAKLSGAVALFLLRREAFFLFTVGLSADVIGLMWQIPQLTFSSTAHLAFVLIGGMISLFIAVAIWFYSWKLMKRGVLT